MASLIDLDQNTSNESIGMSNGELNTFLNKLESFKLQVMRVAGQKATASPAEGPLGINITQT